MLIPKGFHRFWGYPLLDRLMIWPHRQAMSRTPRPRHLHLSSPAEAHARLPALELDPGVRLVLEGSDQVAVEAAVAAVRACFGGRFAVTDRRFTARGEALQVSGSLRITPADALDLGAGSSSDDQLHLPGL